MGGAYPGAGYRGGVLPDSAIQGANSLNPYHGIPLSLKTR